MQNIKTLLINLNQKPIAFQPIYGKITGSATCGLLLSQIVYWWTHTISSENPEGEFYKTDDDFVEETTLGLYDLKGAKKRLIELGLVTVTRKGIPAKSYYKLDYDSLIEKISSYGKNPDLGSKPKTSNNSGKTPSDSVVGKTNNKSEKKPSTSEGEKQEHNIQRIPENKERGAFSELKELFLAAGGCSDSTSASPHVWVCLNYLDQRLGTQITEYLEHLKDRFEKKKPEVAEYLSKKCHGGWINDWELSKLNPDRPEMAPERNLYAGNFESYDELIDEVAYWEQRGFKVKIHDQADMFREWGVKTPCLAY